MDTNIIRTILWSSVGVVVVFAIVSYIVIFIKIKKKKDEIKRKQELIHEMISTKDSEIKMHNREDFGQGDYKLQNLLGKTINHEIVEFCINTCIRNNYKKILLIGQVEPYEAIVLSNKINGVVYVKKSDFDIDSYNEVMKYEGVSNHKIKICDSIDLGEDTYDSIMVLNSFQDFDNLFKDNNNYLKNDGMFVFANVKSNKKSAKKLINEVKKLNYRHEMLNWYTGFIMIVKSFV